MAKLVRDKRTKDVYARRDYDSFLNDKIIEVNNLIHSHEDYRHYLTNSTKFMFIDDVFNRYQKVVTIR